MQISVFILFESGWVLFEGNFSLWVSLMIFWSLLINLEPVFTSATGSVFNKLQAFHLNGTDRICFYLQAVIESLLVKLQTFTITGSGGGWGRACLYHHAVVASFSVNSQVLTINSSDGVSYKDRFYLHAVTESVASKASAVFLFFFYQGAYSQTHRTAHRRAGNRRGPFFIPLYHFSPLTNIPTFILQLCSWDDYHIFLIARLVYARLLLDEIYHLIELLFERLMM